MPILKPEIDLHPGNLFASPDGTSGWMVAHVRSRREKSLARYLLHYSVPFYLPQTQKERWASGRTRVSYLPLFPGYVFLPISAAERRRVQQSNVVVRLLTVPDPDELHRELRSLWLLQSTGARLLPHPYLRPGDPVRIVDGPFKGWTGRILREHGEERWVVSITFLRRSVAATMDRELLRPVAV